MRFYYVPAADPGYRWYRAKDGARIKAREVGGGFALVEVPTNARGLLTWLNEQDEKPEQEAMWGDGPDPTPASPPEAKPSVALQSLKTDEDFDTLPLARQLHFAAIAMENARANIKETV